MCVSTLSAAQSSQTCVALMLLRPDASLRGGTDMVCSFCVPSIQLRLSVGRVTVHVPASIGAQLMSGTANSTQPVTPRARDKERERQSSF